MGHGLHFVKYQGSGNCLIIHKKLGGVVKNPRILNGIRVKFVGDNSTLEIYNPRALRGSKFVIGAANNIKIAPGCSGAITVYGGHHSVIEIGENSALAKTRFILAGVDNASITVGRDCLFANGVLLYGSDTHQILDKNHKQILNDCKKSLEIGNHVWCGVNAIILKGSKIPDNSIVGAGAVVSRRFDVPNVIIAGNPARVVREDIDWDTAAIMDGIR